MSSPVDVLVGTESEGTDAEKPRDVLRQSLITGAAIALPLLVTLIAIGVVVNVVSNTLNPGVLVLKRVTGSTDQPELLVKGTTLLLFVLVLGMVGYVAEYHPGGHRINRRLDEFMESLPGIGPVYTSFNEMAELLVDSDTESFREVKLVEYPTDGSYVVAFKTAETPDAIAADTGHEEMETLFMPMAPNPVMGGFVIHVSSDRVFDVDLTVEQGIRSIVTSGVAVGEEDPGLRGLTRQRLRELAETPGTKADRHGPSDPGR